MSLPKNIERRVSDALESRRSRGMFRSLTLSSSSNLVDFSSNDYLSFSHTPSLNQQFLSALSKSPYGTYGPASSRLLDGNTELHEAVEGLCEEFFQSPFVQIQENGIDGQSKGRFQGKSALLFNSGHSANVSIFSVLPSENSYIIFDELIHASVHDGMRSSRVPISRRLSYKHGDSDSLRRIIASIPPLKRNEEIWVVTESLYSMDGDWGNLQEIVDITRSFDLLKDKFILVVDEAHSTGICGKGKGLVCELGLEREFCIRVHTFGKAISSGGAVVLLPPILRDFMINYARPLIYSTGLSHMNVISIICALEYLKSPEGQSAISSLTSLCSYTTTSLSSFLPITSTLTSTSQVALVSIPWSILSRPSQIIPLLTPHANEISEFLKTKGFLCRSIRYPTVPKGSERIRICLHAKNSIQQVDSFIIALKQWISIKNENSKSSLNSPLPSNQNVTANL